MCIFLQIWKLFLQSPFFQIFVVDFCVCIFYMRSDQINSFANFTNCRFHQQFQKGQQGVSQRHHFFWKLMPLVFGPIKTDVRKDILLNCDSLPLNWTSSPVHCNDTRSSLQTTLSENQTKLHSFPQFFHHDIFLQMSRKYVSVFNEDYVLDQ